MSAPKQTEEQISWAKWWARDHGCGGWGELADRLAQREAAVEKRGREAGIREAARGAGLYVSRRFKDDLEALACEGELLNLITTGESAKPLTGPELAQQHGFPPLAESGAARVPGVDAGPPADEETDR